MLTQQQLELRARGIGGSDVKTFIAKNKNSLSYKRFVMSKVKGSVKEPLNNIYIILGNILEPYVQEAIGAKNLDDKEYILEINDVKFIGHVDGEQGNTLVEIKCSKHDMDKLEKTYHDQIQTYLTLRNWDNCLLVKCDTTLFQGIFEIVVKSNNLDSTMSFIDESLELKITNEMIDMINDLEVDIKDLIETRIVERDETFYDKLAEASIPYKQALNYAEHMFDVYTKVKSDYLEMKGLYERK